jgi:hypothetical protein
MFYQKELKSIESNSVSLVTSIGHLEPATVISVGPVSKKWTITALG